MGNIWPYRWALYLHFLIKLPRCVFLRSPLYISQGSGRSGWIRCPHGLGRPAPWAPSRPDGTGSPAWARWLSLRARREKKKRERERERASERERPWKKRNGAGERLAGGVTQTVVNWLQEGVAKVTEDSHPAAAFLRGPIEGASSCLVAAKPYTEEKWEVGCLGNRTTFLPIWLASTNQSIDRSSVYTPVQSPAPITIPLVTTLPTRFLLHLEVPGKI